MRMGNSQRYDQWAVGDDGIGNIIYLDDLRIPEDDGGLKDYRNSLRRRRSTGRADVFWNIAFTVLCVSVLICLFLH